MIRSALMTVMTSAAIKAGRGLKRDFGEVGELQVSMKGPGDFVSLADKRAEKTLYQELAKARPGYPPSMPSFEGQLKEKELAGLIAYIKSLKQ